MSKPGWIIKSVILFCEALFEGDSYALHPNQATSSVTIPIKYDKNMELTLDIRILLGPGIHSQQFFIYHEPKYLFRRFSMLKYIGQDQKLLAALPDSQVMFVLEKALVQDLIEWAQRVFVLSEHGDLQKTLVQYNAQQVQMKFIDARNSRPLIISASMSGAGLQVTVVCESMEICGDIVQDFVVSHLKVSDMDSQANFPSEMQRVTELLARIEEANQLKTHFAANISDTINSLKVSIVKAEAALLIDDMYFSYYSCA